MYASIDKITPTIASPDMRPLEKRSIFEENFSDIRDDIRLISPPANTGNVR